MIKPYVMGGLYGLVLICSGVGGGYLAESYAVKEHQRSLLDTPRELAAQSGCTDFNTLAVVRSLRQHPEKWKADDFRVYRDEWGSDDDVYIWTGNEEYGLDLSRSQYANNNSHYPFSDQCRALLYKNLQAWQKFDWNRRLK